MVHSKESYKAQ